MYNNAWLFQAKSCFLGSKTNRVSAEHHPVLTNDTIGGRAKYLLHQYKSTKMKSFKAVKNVLQK